MEKAIFLRRISELNDDAKEYDCVYFGNEFCQWLLPNVSDLNSVDNFCKENDKRLVIVTPWVTDAGLDMVRKLISEYLRDNDHAEVVVNDIGILKLIHDEFKGKATIIAGRLLSNQRRDPRTLQLKDIDSKELYEHYKCSSFDYQLMIDLLNDYGVKRVEIDNLLQGISTPNDLNGVSFSIYYPYNYVTVTRNCPFCYDDELWKNKAGCMKKCISTTLKMDCDEIDEPLILKGTAIFIKNDVFDIDDNKLVDRLVYSPDVPV